MEKHIPCKYNLGSIKPGIIDVQLAACTPESRSWLATCETQILMHTDQANCHSNIDSLTPQTPTENDMPFPAPRLVLLGALACCYAPGFVLPSARLLCIYHVTGSPVSRETKKANSQRGQKRGNTHYGQ